MPTNILRLTLKNPPELERVGNCFGAVFLHDLVRAPHPAPVVSLYGHSGSGKSTFARGAMATLPAPFTAYDHIIRRPYDDDLVSEQIVGNQVLRHTDFGPKTIAPHFRDNMAELHGVETRARLRKMNPAYQYGLEFKENPPLPHAEESDVLFIQSRIHFPCDERTHATNYFNSMRERLAHADRALHPSTFKLLGMGRSQHTRALLTEMANMQQDVKQQAATATPSQRMISIILVNPELAAPFNRFKKAVAGLNL